jgi:hypothetical protein
LGTAPKEVAGGRTSSGAAGAGQRARWRSAGAGQPFAWPQPRGRREGRRPLRTRDPVRSGDELSARPRVRSGYGGPRMPFTEPLNAAAATPVAKTRSRRMRVLLSTDFTSLRVVEASIVPLDLPRDNQALVCCAGVI